MEHPLALVQLNDWLCHVLVLSQPGSNCFRFIILLLDQWFISDIINPMYIRWIEIQVIHPSRRVNLTVAETVFVSNGMFSHH